MGGIELDFLISEAGRALMLWPLYSFSSALYSLMNNCTQFTVHNLPIQGKGLSLKCEQSDIERESYHVEMGSSAHGDQHDLH